MRKTANLDERRRRRSAHFRPVESQGTTLPDCALGYDPNGAWLASLWGREYYSRGKYAARGGTMQVSEILKVKGNALFTIAPEGKLTEAVSVMAQHNMGSLVVIDKGRMVGMLTFREILSALDKGHGALDDPRVADAMDPDP